MNTAILQKYGLEMKKSSKAFHGHIHGILAPYIRLYRYPDYVQDFINDVDLAMNGNFDKIEDTDRSDGLTSDLNTHWDAHITPLNFEIRHRNQPYQDRLIIPLEDWKEILISWKECLEV